MGRRWRPSFGRILIAIVAIVFVLSLLLEPLLLAS
jgi:hypothetical protein